MMMTKKSSRDHCDSLLEYLNIYEQNEYAASMKDLISLKALVDLIILYNLDNETIGKIDIRNFGDLLLRISFKSDIKLKIAAIEGN